MKEGHLICVVTRKLINSVEFNDNFFNRAVRNSLAKTDEEKPRHIRGSG